MEKKYRTVLADPPWPEYGGGKIKRGADRHYRFMRLPEITEFMKALPYAEQCHLYLWVTNNHLEAGLQLIRDLGFTYKTNLVWVKDRFGLGQYFRGQHELLLFATKGPCYYKRKETDTRSRCAEPSVILAKRRAHSHKPYAQYRIVEATSAPPYLEVFARSERVGWDALGLAVSTMPYQGKLEGVTF